MKVSEDDVGVSMWNAFETASQTRMAFISFKNGFNAAIGAAEEEKTKLLKDDSQAHHI